MALLYNSTFAKVAEEDWKALLVDESGVELIRSHLLNFTKRLKQLSLSCRETRAQVAELLKALKPSRTR